MSLYKEMYSNLEEWAKTGDYPVFDTDKFVDFHMEFPFFMYAPQKIIKNRRVPIDKIYGDNWVFEDKVKRGRYPSYCKLDCLLRGFTRTENYYYRGRKIPPVPLVKIFDLYYLDEGNHRLYVSKLLKRKSILADIIVFDYRYFLKHSEVKKFGKNNCLVYKNQVYSISKEETSCFNNLKENCK